MSNFKNIAVIGSGSWGTALSILLSKNGHNVRLWGHKKELINRLLKDRENVKYLPGASFPKNLSVSCELKDVILGASIVVMVVPSHAFREIFSRFHSFLPNNCRLISAVKGIENDTLLTMTQIMEEILKKQKICYKTIEIGVLSGPSFAKEVALCTPTAVTIGFKNLDTAFEIQKVFVNEYFRVYASNDIIGLEISSALKNVIAIAAGVCDGLGYGLNTRAALITRGLAEMRRLGSCLNAEDTTFYGLSGLGDLVLTCTGDLSRNRMVGINLGKGKKINEIVDEMSMVAEGIKTTKSIYDLAKKHNIDTPIIEQVYNIIYKGKHCSLAVRDLLNRELKVE
ncbi:MAG: NAD(P)-dependent glycerol-3-phosphate dehydrogenase [Proteobacteria bacterium]|nr:NAD(P)-dependent glycerol-3-phosphate dehydrogenase [Pseudomonadota bacterium]